MPSRKSIFLIFLMGNSESFVEGGTLIVTKSLALELASLRLIHLTSAAAAEVCGAEK